MITYRFSAMAIFLWERFVARRAFQIVQCSDSAFGRVDAGGPPHFCQQHYLPTAI